MRPLTEEDLSGSLQDAAGPLRIVGGATRSAVEPPGGEILETGGLSGIVLYEPGALALVVRAGTPLGEVEAALRAEGQRLPFEPPDFSMLLGRTGRSTIGGVAATNASGPSRVRAGACRDSLIGVRFVDGTGRIVKNGGRVMKNVTGYDLAKLMAGSLGTLGVLTEVGFKVLPRAETSATLILHGLDDAGAVATMSAALGSPFEVSGAAHSSAIGTCLRIEGFGESVAYRLERLKALFGGPGAVETRDAMESESLWASFRDVAPLREMPGDIWRLSVQPSRAPGIVADVQPDSHFYDWGGGLIWLSVATGTDLRAALGGIKGHATLIRPGSGANPPHRRLPPTDPLTAAISARLKAAYDPRGILPGLMA